MKKLILAGVFLISACATDPGVSNKVNAVGAGLMVAEKAWVQTCTDVPTLPICVDPLKQKIKDIDKKAYDYIELAKQNEAYLSIAIDMVGQFTAATTVK